MHKRSCVVLMLVVLVAAGATAQQGRLPRILANETDVEAFEADFLTRFLAGDFDEAFDIFRSPLSALSESEIANLESSTTQQLSGFQSTYGNPVDFRIARRHDVPGMLLRREYLLRYEFLPLRAEFVYYTDGTAWRMTYFGWDDNFISLLSD